MTPDFLQIYDTISSDHWPSGFTTSTGFLISVFRSSHTCTKIFQSIKRRGESRRL